MKTHCWDSASKKCKYTGENIDMKLFTSLMIVKD